MARFLVTGGAGFIGCHLVKALITKGHSVRVLDDLSTGRAENLPRGVELIVSSITEPLAVRRAVEDIEGCFHLAAIASVERAHREWLRSHSVNLSGTIAVFEEIGRVQKVRERQVPVVYASSAAVYGDPVGFPISEGDEKRPINAYGADKLGCELHAAVATRVFNIRNIGLRFFNVYGPGQDPKSPYSGVISIFCERFLANSSIEIHGDGGQVRDFVYVEDAVSALLLAMDLVSVEPRVLMCARVSARQFLNWLRVLPRSVGRRFNLSIDRDGPLISECQSEIHTRRARSCILMRASRS